MLSTHASTRARPSGHDTRKFTANAHENVRVPSRPFSSVRTGPSGLSVRRNTRPIAAATSDRAGKSGFMGVLSAPFNMMGSMLGFNKRPGM